MKKLFAAIIMVCLIILAIITLGKLGYLESLRPYLPAAVFSIPPQTIYPQIVQINARVENSPAKIILEWPANQNAGYTVYRRTSDSAAWSVVASNLPVNTSTYVDTNVQVGIPYEYKVYRSTGGEGYIYAGIKIPLADQMGKVVLLVDETIAPQIEPELSLLREDLIGDGWTVIRENVPRNDIAAVDQIKNVKNIVSNHYNTDPSGVKSLFLLGHVPMPYSGPMNPDGHELRPWPTDVFYADITGGSWTWKTAGTPYLNQTTVPSPVELETGRVDLYDLPVFDSKTETDLIKQYLAKDHAFRNKDVSIPQAAYIIDNIFPVTGEPAAGSGWRSFTPIVGGDRVIEGTNFLNDTVSASYLWAQVLGTGGYSEIHCCVSAANYASVNPPMVAFSMFLGSYSGQWDSANNLLRSAIAGANNGLAAVWSGRPNWAFHHMGLGKTLGYSTKVTMNNNGSYLTSYVARGVHTSLMGDPTLKASIVSPVSNLTASVGNGITLSWNPSSDATEGYYVYRSLNPAGQYERITASPITTTSFTDTSGTSNHIYMVRAIKLEITPSGSYYNASRGKFVSISGQLPSAVPFSTGNVSTPATSTPPPTPPPTTSGPDTTAPSVPSGIILTPKSTSSISITWKASTDDTGVVGYTVLRNGIAVGKTSTTLNYLDTGLTANTSYSYSIKAFDASGNTSTPSTPVSTKTKRK